VISLNISEDIKSDISEIKNELEKLICKTGIHFVLKS